MTATFGANINATDTTNLFSPISVDSTTSTKLLDAQVAGAVARIEVNITNNGNKALWLKLQPAIFDNEKKGQRIAPGETKTVVMNGNYSGEISGIMDSGVAKDVLVEWR